MYACMFNGWNGTELDTIVSVSPTYIDVGKERVDGIALYTAQRDGLDWFIPLDTNQTDDVVKDIARIYPNLIDLTEMDAVHMDEDENINADEWAWFTGRPAKRGLFEKAMSKMGLTE